jgi:thiopeptide-type bacteriocin biosynthesis protein
LGRPGWIDDVVRPRIERAIRPFSESGLIRGVEYGEYAREWERYGGPRGMELAERIFLHDSVACLELLEAEARGFLRKSRREYSLMFTERVLDLFGFDGSRRTGRLASGCEFEPPSPRAAGRRTCSYLTGSARS